MNMPPEVKIVERKEVLKHSRKHIEVLDHAKVISAQNEIAHINAQLLSHLTELMERLVSLHARASYDCVQDVIAHIAALQRDHAAQEHELQMRLVDLVEWRTEAHYRAGKARRIFSLGLAGPGQMKSAAQAAYSEMDCIFSRFTQSNREQLLASILALRPLLEATCEPKQATAWLLGAIRRLLPEEYQSILKVSGAANAQSAAPKGELQ